MDSPFTGAASPTTASTAIVSAAVSSFEAIAGKPRAPSVSLTSPTHAPVSAVPASVASAKHSRPTSRILSGTELSPLKILQSRVTGGPGSPDGVEGHHHRDSSDHASVSVSGSASASGSVTSSPPTTATTARSMSVSSSGPMLPPPLGRTPRKIMSPDRRFPIKVNIPIHPTRSGTATPTSPPRQPMTMPDSPEHAIFSQLSDQQSRQLLDSKRISLDEAIEHNENLKHAIEMFEDETNAIEKEIDSMPSSEGTAMHNALGISTGRLGDESAGDDTMVSTFSNFSAGPGITMLSKLGAGGSTADGMGTMRTPRGLANGPALNRMAVYDHGNTSSMLIDFTEQLRAAHSQQQAASASATPRKNPTNILDFEIPPLPTPRSIPTVTPRELEGLKSNYLSEISSLKATLSGKEAEVLALKTAVGDAEKRVGECLEQMREDQTSRQQLVEEKELWERRGREMEEMLRKVKAEMMAGQQEREELEGKFDELDKRREAAEMMAQEAETKMAVMRASERSAAAANGGSSGGTTSIQREVELAVERVARDLHAAYKAKHEGKVAALKKSYEARWEKRVRELEGAAEALARENESLRAGRQATLTRLVAAGEEEEERRLRGVRDAAQIKELGAEVEKLEAVVRTIKADNAELRTLLEQERVEKGELVILAEEMMSMQQSFIGNSGANGVGNAASSRACASPNVAEGRSGSATGSHGSYGSRGSRGSASPVPERYEQPRARQAPKTPSKTATATRTMHSSSVSNMAPPSASKRNSMTYGGSAVTPKPSRPMSMHGVGRMSGLKPPSAHVTSGASRIGRIGTGQGASHERKPNSLGGIPRPGSGMAVRGGGLMSSIERMGNYRGRE